MDELPTTADAVRAAEDRLRTDRKHSNELIGLVKLCEAASASTPKSAPAVLAAVQACRALFQSWAEGGELQLRQGEEDEDDVAAAAEDGALAAYRAWLLRTYRRFVGALRDLLSSAKAPLALRMTALDTLFILASIEAKHAKRHKGIAFHPAALEAAGGAFRAALNALATSRRAPPEELLTRLRDEHIAPHLDAQFYLLRHVKRLADQRAPHDTPPPPDRILALLRMVTPIAKDVEPRDASFLSASVGGAMDGAGGGKKRKRAGGDDGLPADARKLLERKPHRGHFCKAWRAVLECPNLPLQHYREVLRTLPEEILPHVPRPLVYCDLLSDGYAKGGVEALLALKGLFVLMTQYNLEYPKFYPRLYNLLTAEALSGPNRASFAMEARRFLSSSGLPAYLLAAFAKRFARLALSATPSGAALGCALVFNLMLQHPTARVLVHRKPKSDDGAANGASGEGAGDDDDDEEEAAAQEEEEEEEEERTDVDDSTPEALLSAAVTADPFVAEEEDPEKCNALNSSLWEIDQLRQHVCPTVASLASLFAAPMTATTPPIEIEPLAALTYQSLGQLETRKKLRGVPLATRAPRGLLADPIDSSLPGASSVKLTAGLGSWA